MLLDLRADGVQSSENPRGGVRGDAGASMRVTAAYRDDVCLETPEMSTCFRNVLWERKVLLGNASGDWVVASLLVILLCDVGGCPSGVILSSLLGR